MKRSAILYLILGFVFGWLLGDRMWGTLRVVGLIGGGLIAGAGIAFAIIVSKWEFP